MLKTFFDITMKVELLVALGGLGYMAYQYSCSKSLTIPEPEYQDRVRKFAKGVHLTETTLIVLGLTIGTEAIIIL